MLVNFTIEEFLCETASSSPAPGGGSISALSGALGAALSSMVASLTLKNVDGDVKEELQQYSAKASDLLKLLADAVDKDTEAFNMVMEAFKMPKGTEEEKKTRSAAIQNAMKHAADLPYMTAKLCVEVMKLSIAMLEKGNRNAASDAAVSGLVAYAGFKGAIYNVKINLSSIKDEAYLNNMKIKLVEINSDAESIYKNITERADAII